MKVALPALLAALLLGIGCDSESPDLVPPSVNWAWPAAGDTLVAGTNTLVVQATDDRAMKWVVFFANSELLGFVEPDGSDTFHLHVDLPAISTREYELSAFARDKGNNDTRAAVTVVVRP